MVECVVGVILEERDVGAVCSVQTQCPFMADRPEVSDERGGDDSGALVVSGAESEEEGCGGGLRRADEASARALRRAEE